MTHDEFHSMPDLAAVASLAKAQERRHPRELPNLDTPQASHCVKQSPHGEEQHFQRAMCSAFRSDSLTRVVWTTVAAFACGFIVFWN